MLLLQALLVFCHTSPASKAANCPNRIEMAVKYGASRPVLSRMALDSGPFASAANSSRQTGNRAARAICQAERKSSPAEHLLHLAEEALGFGAGLAGPLELLEQFLLLGREVGRRLDVDLDVHVAALGRAHDRHAPAAQAELVAALGAGRDVDARHLAVERRHLDVAAERGLHHRDRHAAMDVRALALEQLVATHRQEDIEVAGGTTARAGLAFAGE